MSPVTSCCRWIFTSVCFLAIVLGQAQADIPQIMSYQGKVTDSGGLPVADGSYTMQFRIYDSSSSGTLLWDSGARSILLSGGVFGVLLGESPQPALDLPFDEDYWLLVTFEGTNQTPRQRLVSAGYSYMASGLVPGTEVSGEIPGGYILRVDNNASGGIAMEVHSGSPYPPSDAGPAIIAHTSGGCAAIEGHALGGFSGQTGVLGTSNWSYGVKGSVFAYGGMGYHYGVFGEYTGGLAGGPGVGVGGEGGEYGGYFSGTWVGVHGSSTSTTSGVGVYGHAMAGSGETHGVHGESNSSEGMGVYGEGRDGVWGETSDAGGWGVYGNTTSTSGGTRAVYGRSASTSGYGVYGYAHATSGSNFGVYGKSNSPTGIGVYGQGTGESGNGVEGYAAWTGYGVYGKNDFHGNYGYIGSSTAAVFGYSETDNAIVGFTQSGHAGHFAGDVHVIGDITKNNCYFLIDHPLDPENKLLRHSCVESPENLVIYRGKARLDARGQALVELPDYFKALANEDEATVSLTSIGRPFPTGYQFQPDYLAFEVFGEPTREIAWVVYADRDDPIARRLARPVVEDKGPNSKYCARGELLYPTAFGYPESRGTNYKKTLSAKKQAQPTGQETDKTELRDLRN